MHNFFREFYGKTKLEEIANLTANQDYELLKCLNCSFIWQKNQPDEILQNKLYNEWISFEDSLKKAKKKVKENIFFSTALKLTKNLSKETNILDYGAGIGNFSVFAQDKKFNIYALETSPKRIEHLSKLKIKIISLENYKNYENYFDFIFINQVVEHLSDLEFFFSIVNFISRSKCIIYVSVPKPKKINNKITKGPYQPLEHLNAFNNKNLTYLFKKNNYKKLPVLFFFKFFLKGKISFSFLIKRLYFQLFSTSLFFIK